MTLQFSSRAQNPASPEYCDRMLGGYNTTVLMVADPGDFTGSAEAKYYIANLEVHSHSCHNSCMEYFQRPCIQCQSEQSSIQMF